ncbi:hypothetical protein MJ634_002915 [Providencia rettgeri]|uniref:hypothetical protein n=1 Tax=Providencia rettgeri TaxID=587 RepID=UPI001B360157|nr:hypothetical protein [Providencia rettgeri]ELR5089794.1 hypothetical protein [Providencia rettgeri]MBQ0605481.1 hypothetical protein [Providencia rettgeri]MCJ2222008.1 hypothetical protein [Providencia rettgeri]MDI7242377.1 hypothetical protein [Providencia rettgeri]MDY0819469.1 hypothetical protein [Providencia rettgeri]
MDKSRQQFEETIKKLSDPSEFESKLKRANNGLNYADCDVDLMWISWQASRESLINSLEPVGYAAEIDINEIEIYGQLFLNEDPTEETNILLYRLDK